MDSILECGGNAGNAGLFQGGENNGVQVCLQIWATVDTTMPTSVSTNASHKGRCFSCSSLTSPDTKKF